MKKAENSGFADDAFSSLTERWYMYEHSSERPLIQNFLDTFANYFRNSYEIDTSKQTGFVKLRLLSKAIQMGFSSLQALYSVAQTEPHFPNNWKQSCRLVHYFRADPGIDQQMQRALISYKKLSPLGCRVFDDAWPNTQTSSQGHIQISFT